MNSWVVRGSASGTGGLRLENLSLSQKGFCQLNFCRNCRFMNSFIVRFLERLKKISQHNELIWTSQGLLFQTLPVRKIKKKKKYTWHLTCDTWHLKCDTWHLTHDMWKMVEGEYSHKISAPQLFRFGCNDILKVWRKRMTDWLTDWMSDKGDCRTAPATPGLLITYMFLAVDDGLP